MGEATAGTGEPRCTHPAAAGPEETRIGRVAEVHRAVLVEERCTGPWQEGGIGVGAARRIGQAGEEGIVLGVGMCHIDLEAVVRYIGLVVGARHTDPVVGTGQEGDGYFDNYKT